MEDAPIGIFDSGLGGPTTVRAVMDKLPDEQILYLGGAAHTPYGLRPVAKARYYTLACLNELASRRAKALVIACNTATAAALSDTRERYWIDAHIPVVEVITPAVCQTAATVRNHRIGVIDTLMMIQSEAHKNTLSAAPGLSVVQQVYLKFVEFIERGITVGAELEVATREYLQPLKEAEVDTVILGCMRYPLLTGVIARIMEERVSLVVSSEVTANITYNELIDWDLLHAPWARDQGLAHEFFTAGELDSSPHLVRRFLGPEIARTQETTIGAGARA